MVGGLTLTMQGFGQHEPLVRPVLHAVSLYASHLTLPEYRPYVREGPNVCRKIGFPGWKGE